MIPAHRPGGCAFTVRIADQQAAHLAATDRPEPLTLRALAGRALASLGFAASLMFFALCWSVTP